MKKFLLRPWLFLGLMLLSGCSWVEYFTITNTGNTSIFISYSLDTTNRGYFVFDDEPRAYSIQKNAKIDWDKPIEIIEKDSSLITVSFSLPAQSTVIIGTLFNDHYKGYDQYLINGRTFNLKQIQIIADNDTSIITPETFDKYFAKIDGRINLNVK